MTLLFRNILKDFPLLKQLHTEISLTYKNSHDTLNVVFVGGTETKLSEGDK